MQDPYSLHKVRWHPQTIESLQAGQVSPPIHVQLIISDFCNHDCEFCAYRLNGYSSNELFQEEEGQSLQARNPMRMIGTEKVYEILDDCRELGVKAIQFTGGGEPTMHPDFTAILRYAQQLGMDTALVTNGSQLRQAMREVVLSCQWVRISVDAGSSETYARIRRVGKNEWYRMADRVQALVYERNIRQASLTIGVGFVATPTNWEELYTAVEQFRAWGVDNVRLGVAFNPEGSTPYAPFRQPLIEQVERAVRDFQTDTFTISSRIEERLAELDQGPPTQRRCLAQQVIAYIGGDLHLYRCCVLGYNSHGLLGSLEHERFKDLWPRVAAKMARFDGRTCERCQFTELNHVLAGAAAGTIKTCSGDPPLHVNFV